MTMFPAPPPHHHHQYHPNNHHLFYSTPPPPSDVMTRLPDACAYAFLNPNNNNNNNNNNPATTNTNTCIIPDSDSNRIIINNNCFLLPSADLPISRTYIHNNFGTTTIVETDVHHEQHSTNSNNTSTTTLNDLTAASSPSNTKPANFHIQSRTTSWLQLGLGDDPLPKSTNISPPPPPQHHHHHHALSTTEEVGNTGLMLELNLGGGGGGGEGGGGGGGGVVSTSSTAAALHQTTSSPLVPNFRVNPHQQRNTPAPDYYCYGSTSSFGCGSASASATNFLSHPIIPSIPTLPCIPQFHHHQQLSDHHHHHNQTGGWGLFNNNNYNNNNSISSNHIGVMRSSSSSLVGVAGCSSSISPTSSSSAPVRQGQDGPFLTRPFAPSAGSSVDSDIIKLIHPPPRRPHSGVWFMLQASLHQSREPYLPQVSKSFLRIKDGRMKVRLVKKYLANKLGLDSESQVEIRCRGQVLSEMLTLEEVRDQIWSGFHALSLLPPDSSSSSSSSSTSHHLMLLQYATSHHYSSTLP